MQSHDILIIFLLANSVSRTLSY